jgi:hypothetical protein
MDFENLKTIILTTSFQLQHSAVKAVNSHITLRNWLIGFYIVEFEQAGDDKAKYGTKLLSILANELKLSHLKNVNERELRNYRTFYKTYIHFSSYLTSLPIYTLVANDFSSFPIRGTVSPKQIEIC